jgi:hypothetical protein
VLSKLVADGAGVPVNEPVGFRPTESLLCKLAFDGAGVPATKDVIGLEVLVRSTRFSSSTVGTGVSPPVVEGRSTDCCCDTVRLGTEVRSSMAPASRFEGDAVGRFTSPFSEAAGEPTGRLTWALEL